jgi:hypothetical protein
MNSLQLYQRKIRFSILFLAIGLASIMQGLKAQDQEKESIFSNAYQKIDLSYLFGVQVYNNNIIYSPGYTIHLSHGYAVNKDIRAGIGVGLIDSEDVGFIPVYAELIGNKSNKANTPFIKFQLGYSFINKSDTDLLTEYDLEGGFYFNAGIGRKIEVNDKFSMLFHWSYSHQFAEMEYNVFGDQENSEELNYDMILITIGVLFGK